MKRPISLLLAFVLFLPVQAWGTIASVGALGNDNSETANTTLVVALAAQCDAGNLCICGIAFDNTATTDVNTTEISGVVDSSGGNTWTELRSFINGQGTIAAGAGIAVWKTRAAANIPIAGTITATFANTITSKAISCWEFTTGADIQIAPGGSGVGYLDLASDGATDPPSMALASLPSKEYLFIRAIAVERNTNTDLTETTDWTEIPDTLGDTGSATTSMAFKGEFRILTGTGATSDPTLTISASDWASTLLALEEIVPTGGSRMGLMEVGK